MLDSPIQQIKDRLDIVEVIQGYIKLHKAGANFRAICPFHAEKKPSFFVSPARQIWHCFGCNSGGDLFRFVMQIEGIEFGDALRLLAQRAGVELRRQDPQLKTERQRFYEICDLACKFFERQLEGSKTGQDAKKYLFKRGLTEDSIKKWRLGLAPNSWQGLSDFLIEKGYTKEEISQVGLAIRRESFSEDGKDYFDRFRGRIMFPISDSNSQIVGFGGRILEYNREATDPDPAKYVNSPSTLLYDKSRVLYGLDKAKIQIRKKDFCILVEGYIDTILSYQAGFENTIASSGTALTPYQLKILKRYSENLLTAFDMDIAGTSATKRGIDLAQAKGFNIKIITMEKDADPADIISRNPDKWNELISQAKSITEFYFENAFSQFDEKSAEGKKEISKILLPVIKIIPNKIEQYHWIAKLAKNLGVKEEVISEEMKKTSSPQFPNVPEGGEDLTLRVPKSRLEILEERILILVLKFPSFLDRIGEEKFGMFTPRSKEILFTLKENPKFDIEGEISPETLDYFNYLFLKKDIEEIEAPEKEIENCLKEIHSIYIKTRLDEISQDIKKAEQERDFQMVDHLTQKFNQLSQQLQEA